MRLFRPPRINPLLAMFLYGTLTGAFVTLLVVTRFSPLTGSGDQGEVKGVSTETQAQSQAAVSLRAVSAPSQETLSDSVVVKRVIDGDTVELESGLRVRYIGINSPEVAERGVEGCLAAAAQEANNNLVQGKTVRMERDTSDKDRYGRLLRYVWLDTIQLNATLVEQGLARAIAYPPDVKYQKELAAAETRAKGARRGMWGDLCRTAASGDAIEEQAVTPALPPVSECTIKGNISNGEKIYHLSGCKSYTKTVITPATGERWFCTEEEARAAGWRKAKDCPN